MLVLGLLFALIAATLDSTWGLAAGAAREWFATSPARLRRLGGTGGLTMVGLGIGLALHRPGRTRRAAPRSATRTRAPTAPAAASR